MTSWMAYRKMYGAANVPLVSVCIPAYRGEQHIGAAIASVLAQTWRNFELIIVDDLSSDGTTIVAAGFSDPRIRILHNEKNLGAAGNWNRCLEEARGRYIKLLPQDDTLAPRCLERQVAALEADGTLALAFCARQVVDARNRPLMRRGYGQRGSGRIEGKKIVRRCLRAGTNLVGEPGAVLFRRELADQIGGFDGSIPYVLDLDYWVRLLALGDAYYLSEPLASFRVSASSWSVRIGKGQSEEFCRFIERAARPPELRVTALDRTCGRWAARLNNVLRRLVYRWVLDAHR